MEKTGDWTPPCGDWLEQRLSQDPEMIEEVSEAERRSLAETLYAGGPQAGSRGPTPPSPKVQASSPSVRPGSGKHRECGIGTDSRPGSAASRSASRPNSASRNRPAVPSMAPNGSLPPLSRQPPPLGNPGFGSAAVPKPTAVIRSGSWAARHAGSVAMASTGGASTTVGAPKGSNPVKSAIDDRQKIARMAQRLSQVERLNVQQAMIIAKKSQEIDALKAEVEILRECTGEGVVDELTTLRAECEKYKRQVIEMTAFLADYGLNWVGDPEDEEGEEAEEEVDDPDILERESPILSTDIQCGGDQLATPKGTGRSQSVSKSSTSKSPSGRGAHPPINIHELQDSIRNLNTTVEQGSKVVSRRIGGTVHAQFVSEHSSLPLVLFSDGLKLGELQFEPYGSRSANGMLRDIMDGYFPYALKDAYPDGVNLKVVDRTSQTFSTWSLRSVNDPDLTSSGSSCAPSTGSVVRNPSVGAPARIAKNGEVCQSGKLTGQSQEAGPAYRPCEDEISLLSADRNAQATISRLQVRTEGGAKVLLKMEPHQTIGDVTHALDRWREGKGLSKPAGKKLILRTALPRCSYVNLDQTLEMAGLTPSATLFVSVEPADSSSPS